MKLYNHIYSETSNKITVKPVEVKETNKLYKVLNYEDCLGSYYKQLNKADLGILMTGHTGYTMILTEINKELFKNKIVKRQLEKVELAKCKLEREEKRLRMLTEVEI